MSFGFDCSSLPKDLRDLDEALERARNAGILIFAAAANSGHHRRNAWPARDDECAICVHSCNDYGSRSSEYTPSADEETTNFIAYGENIRSHWPTTKGGGFRVMTGNSTATPVAVSMAALLLAFVNQSICRRWREEVDRSVNLKKLRKLHYMRKLLKRISERRRDNYYWIHSSLLWKDYQPDSEQGKDPESAIAHAWEVIRKALSK